MSSFSSLIENKNIVQLRPWTAVFKNELGIPAFSDQQHHQEWENIPGGATMYILNFQSTLTTPTTLGWFLVTWPYLNSYESPSCKNREENWAELTCAKRLLGMLPRTGEKNAIGDLKIRRQRWQREHQKSNRFNNQNVVRTTFKDFSKDFSRINYNF